LLAKRIRRLNDIPPKKGPVVYWMNRDQRVEDNWGLLYAQTEALAVNQPLFVIFTLVEEFLGASSDHYSFMAKGLTEVSRTLKSLHIPFHILPGDPQHSVPGYIHDIQAGMLISDVHVLRECVEWRKKVARKIAVSFLEVDAHNIVPVWEASNHAEYGAYTIRPKLKKILPDYLIEIPQVEKHPHNEGIEVDSAMERTAETNKILL
jgi:deoxyribodipyrimidine photo-lyase